MFKLNDHVVYSSHGVFKVTFIKTLGIPSKPAYVLKSIRGNMSLLVQSDSPDIRPIIDSAMAKDILNQLGQPHKVSPDKTRNRRYREYMELLKTGNIQDTVMVYKDLRFLALDKDLRFGEKKMLDHSKELFASEIALALGLGIDQTMSLIDITTYA